MSSPDQGADTEAWRSFLTEDERRILLQSEDWANQKANWVGRATSFLGRPVDMAYKRVPESIKASISQTILSILEKVRSLSQNTVRRQEVYDQLSELAGQDVRDARAVRRIPVALLDVAAGRIQKNHRNLALVQGGATGMAGLVGIPADLPSLYFLVFREVEELALCYGFPIDSEAEVAHLFKIVDIGHYVESEEKRKALLELADLQQLLTRGEPIKDLERTMVAKSLQALAARLAASLTRRKLLQGVAVIGGLVGASVNSALVMDVGQTAYHSYRRRLVMEKAAERQGWAAEDRAKTSPAPSTAPEQPEVTAEIVAEAPEAASEELPAEAPPAAGELATEMPEVATEMPAGPTSEEPLAEDLLAAAEPVSDATPESEHLKDPPQPGTT